MSETAPPERPPERPGDQRHVFLIGFMAAGKTSVAELVAPRLGLPFRDLDREIERVAGQPVPALFAGEGEVGFRRREAEALSAVLDQPAAVVATGGGTACHGENLAQMRQRGLVITLTAPLDTLRARAGDPATRPLLQRGDSTIRDLFAARLPFYRQAHATVATEDLSLVDVASKVAAIVRASARIPTAMLGTASIVALPGRAYPILVADKALVALGDLARRTLGDAAAKVGVVSDSNVAPLHGEPARAALAGAGFEVVSEVIPAGEPSKCFAEYARLCESLARAGLDRRSAIVALGGGVVGDLAGLVAATLFRGIACIQVPTSIVAMVDSAIGGKTGIDIAAGKNLVGAFWQPRLVLADTATLATLPVRERRAAFGELVKYGLLDSEELYAAVDALAADMNPSSGPPGDSTASGDVFAPGRLPGLTDVIRRCAAVKSWIVTRDEREETGERALLNLGHTVGHAIEAAAGYGEVLHGEAVALGLVAACRVSARLGLCSTDLEARVADTLGRAGLDTRVDPWLAPNVLDRIGVDKKRTGKNIRFIAVKSVGQAAPVDLPLSDLVRILRE